MKIAGANPDVESHVRREFSRLNLPLFMEFTAVSIRQNHPCTFLKACNAKHLVRVQGLTLTHASFIVEVNIGTLSHVMHGRRFPGSFPIPPL